MGQTIFSILIFPGFLFLLAFSFVAEFVDRKLYARFQNRQGPPWFQPFADFIKLAGKEEIVPEEADAPFFKVMPAIALTSSITAFLYIPLWGSGSLMPFSGDIIVVLYLLTIPTLTFFLGGWYSRSCYAIVGAARALMQIFAYEIPLLLGVLAPALLAGTWSFKDLTAFYAANPLMLLVNIPAFVVSIIALMGKLEKVPFDIPEAETEIVAGSFTEYSGRLYAFIRLTLNIEMVAGASLLAAVFLPLGLDLPAAAAVPVFFAKILFILVLIALIRSVFARMRIDQMIEVLWKIFAPIAFLQIVIVLVVKGAFLR